MLTYTVTGGKRLQLDQNVLLFPQYVNAGCLNLTVMLSRGACLSLSLQRVAETHRQLVAWHANCRFQCLVRSHCNDQEERNYNQGQLSFPQGHSAFAVLDFLKVAVKSKSC